MPIDALEFVTGFKANCAIIIEPRLPIHPYKLRRPILLFRLLFILLKVTNHTTLYKVVIHIYVYSILDWLIIIKYKQKNTVCRDKLLKLLRSHI